MLSLHADDLETLGLQLRANPPGVKALLGDLSTERALATLRNDGTWADLNYRDGEDGRIFPLAAHLRRMCLFLDAHPVSAKNREAAYRALSAWLRLDPQSNQGWFQTIGVPQLVGRAALELETELTPEEKTKVLGILRRCVREDGELIYAHAPATGQNLQWQAGLQIMAGYLERDAKQVERYVRRIEQEIRITDQEGIQADLSFHQHGPQLYEGGYGLNFTNDVARLAAQTRGTSFALAEASVDLITRFLLDGQQGMLRGRNWDFTTIGREIGRDGRDARELASAADQLANFGGPRAAELQALARRVRGEDPVSATPSAFRVFWRSDFVSQTRPTIHYSVRMTSTRTYGSESGNGENEQGAFLGDGATTLLRTGEEYRGIFPIWDWRRIPGVTNAFPPGEPMPLYQWGVGSNGGSDFAGGAGDSENGLAAMTLDHLGVHAQKAWFFMGDLMLCLGADLRAEHARAPLITTLNQCWGKGLVTQIPNGFEHDGLAYLNLGSGKLSAEIKKQTGSWRNVDRLQGSPETISGNVFTAWLEHDVSDDKPASYAYLVAPISETKTRPRVLANTAALQAVINSTGDLAQIVFPSPGHITLPDGLSISVNAPCLLQWRRISAEKWMLSVGNPTQRPQTVEVRLSVFLSGENARVEANNTVVDFTFPADPSSVGQPQTRTLSKASSR